MGARTVVGIGYGVVLGVVAFLCAAVGGGHGTYIPAAVSSAPFGLVGIAGGLLGAPFVWACVGALLEPERRRRSAAIAIVVLHYAGAAWLITREPFSDWEYLARVIRFEPAIVLFWALAYVAGQIWVWHCVVDAMALARLRKGL